MKNESIGYLLFQMAVDSGPPDGCDAFVYIHGEKSCDPDKISGLVDSAGSRYNTLSFI